MFSTKIKNFWQHVAQDCKHYYFSTKLLCRETAATARMLRQARRDKAALTYRQKTQLQRTVKDWVLAVPVLAGVIIPGTELLVVAAVKLNFLPSTFQKAEHKEEQERKMLARKLEVSKFLSQMCHSGLSQIRDPALLPHVSRFEEIMAKSKSQRLSPEELRQVAPLFDQALTLSALKAEQLRAVAEMLGLGVRFSTPDMLRKKIDVKIRQLEKEDRRLLFYSQGERLSVDGKEELNLEELKAFCRGRGLRATWEDTERLGRHLREWLDLRQTPVLLRLMANALRNEREDLSQGVQRAIEELPGAALDEAKASVLEHSGREEDQIEADKIRLEIERETGLEEKEAESSQEQESVPAPENTAAEKELQEEEERGRKTAQEIEQAEDILRKEREFLLESKEKLLAELEQKEEELEELAALKKLELLSVRICSKEQKRE